MEGRVRQDVQVRRSGEVQAGWGCGCAGRADDQVKIRGFRIDLVEIDTHLSAHKGMKENVTLVRRGKDEERVLVSYFVPADGVNELTCDVGEEAEGGTGGIKRYRRLIKDTREYLKWPSYSVPTHKLCCLFPCKKVHKC